MENLDGAGEANGIDGTVSISIEVFHYF